MKKKLFLLVSILVILIISKNLFSNDWVWKSSQTPEDVVNFLNGTGAYKYPAQKTKISAAWKNGNIEFTVVYKQEINQQPKGQWLWKKATNPTDVHNCLNGLGAYKTPVKDAHIVIVWKNSYPEFYIFYKPGTVQDPRNWSWKLSADTTDALSFLNGKSVYKQPVTTARMEALNKNGILEFYMFCQKSNTVGSISNWNWKLATNITDTMNFINGKGAYTQPVKDFEICVVNKGSYDEYYIFHNKGTKLWIQSPLSEERFVGNESLSFCGLITSDTPMESSNLVWSSSKYGSLGSGKEININHLSLGNQNVTVTGYGLSATTSIRVYSDLWELYQAAPSQAEIDRVMEDFKFNWIDGNGVDEKWEPYANFQFNQSSPNPSKIVIIAKLDILRHQRFSEPLPFTNGKSAYEHLKSYVKTINLGLGCNDNTGWGGSLNLSRPLSVWDSRSSGTADSCKQPLANPKLYKYTSPLYLLIHEGRHNEPADPGHTSCNNKSNMDQKLEDGSGHAWAALYLMWVYKYGLYDSPELKEEAKSTALSILGSRFCSTPTHSNPKVQAILDELLK